MYNEDNYFEDYGLNGTAVLDNYDDDNYEDSYGEEDNDFEDAILEDDNDFEDAFGEEDDYENAFGEDDDDFEDEFGEDLSERRRRRGWRRRRRKRMRRIRAARRRRLKRFRPRAYKGRGLIKTPAGKARVTLPKNLANKKELQSLDKKIVINNKDLQKNAKAIKDLSSNIKKIDRSIVGKLRSQNRKINKNKKGIDAMQQSVMFSSLLGGSEIQQVELTELDAQGNTTNTVKKHNLKVTKSDNTNALLPMMMGGGTGGSNNMMMPMMMMAMQDNDGNSNDNSMMFLAMAMMGNK